MFQIVRCLRCSTVGRLPLRFSDKIEEFRRAFRKNAWGGIWTGMIYDYTHFHSNAHEVLGIARSSVTVLPGGEGGRRVRLKAGDILILPAGVGYRRVGDMEGLKVVGAYPRGQAHFNMKRKGRKIPKVAPPSTDPLYGEDGPPVYCWQRS